MFSTIKLVFLIIASCSACKRRSGKYIPTYPKQTVQDISNPHVIVQLKDDLVPRTPNSYEYNNTKGIKNVISEFIKRSERSYMSIFGFIVLKLVGIDPHIPHINFFN